MGHRLGVLPEAVALAAILSAPSLPFRRASMLIHDNPDKFNSIVGSSFVSALKSLLAPDDFASCY